jgi:hypothetical protein
MKKVLSFVVMLIFVAGMAMAQNPPVKKTEKKEAKTEIKAEKKEVKADTTKKVQHHKQQPKKAEGKQVENKKK